VLTPKRWSTRHPLVLDAAHDDYLADVPGCPPITKSALWVAPVG
jgi:hypothetical protein